MAVVFGSEIVAEEVYAVLDPLTAFPIRNISVAPEGTGLPAVLHYMEAGTYDGPIGQTAISEAMRYVVRFVCEGASTDPIRAGAEAAFAALDGHEATRSGCYLAFQASGEWPLTTVLEGGVLYRQLGFFLTVNLTQGD